jgi:periplasmic protein TonB
MSRIFKLALAVSFALHAMVFASLRAVMGGGRLPDLASPAVILLVPVQEDFVAKRVERPPEIVTAPPVSVPEPSLSPEPVTPPELPRIAIPAPPIVPPNLVEVADTNSAELATNMPVALAASTEPIVAPPAPEPRQSLVTITGHVKYRRAPQPEYPALARRRKQEGIVLMDVVIAPTGRARSVEVLRSSSFPLLDRAAVEAVQACEFDITSDVAVRAEVPLRFELLK